MGMLEFPGNGAAQVRQPVDSHLISLTPEYRSGPIAHAADQRRHFAAPAAPIRVRQVRVCGHRDVSACGPCTAGFRGSELDEQGLDDFGGLDASDKAQ